MKQLKTTLALTAIVGVLAAYNASAVTVNYEVDAAGPYAFAGGDDILNLQTHTDSVNLTLGGPAVTGEINPFTFTDLSTAPFGASSQTITRNMTILVAVGTESLSQNSTVTVSAGVTTDLEIFMSGSPIAFNLGGGEELIVTPQDFEGITKSAAGAEIDGKILATFQLTSVPEPTTIVSGALLLLPFGFSTMRVLRKNKSANLTA